MMITVRLPTGRLGYTELGSGGRRLSCLATIPYLPQTNSPPAPSPSVSTAPPPSPSSSPPPLSISPHSGPLLPADPCATPPAASSHQRPQIAPRLRDAVEGPPEQPGRAAAAPSRLRLSVAPHAPASAVAASARPPRGGFELRDRGALPLLVHAVGGAASAGGRIRGGRRRRAVPPMLLGIGGVEGAHGAPRRTG